MGFICGCKKKPKRRKQPARNAKGEILEDSGGKGIASTAAAAESVVIELSALGKQEDAKKAERLKSLFSGTGSSKDGSPATGGENAASAPQKKIVYVHHHHHHHHHHHGVTGSEKSYTSDERSDDGSASDTESTVSDG
jgi:hypothetical protein